MDSTDGLIQNKQKPRYYYSMNMYGLVEESSGRI
jgi:hypothetical protein